MGYEFAYVRFHLSRGLFVSDGGHVLVRPRLRRHVLVFIALLMLGGCSHVGCCLTVGDTGADGTRHILVIGIGLVSLPSPSAESAVLVTKVEGVGILVSDQPGLKFNVGYGATTVVAVPNGAEDVRLEVSDRTGGPIRVDAHSARLRTSEKVIRLEEGEKP